MFYFNLGLDNDALYEGCSVQVLAGKKNLITPIPEALNLIGKNAEGIVSQITDRKEICLTGPMAVWAYLVVFHIVVHKFNKVYYDDGRNGPILVAAHG